MQHSSLRNKIWIFCGLFLLCVAPASAQEKPSVVNLNAGGLQATISNRGLRSLQVTEDSFHADLLRPGASIVAKLAYCSGRGSWTDPALYADSSSLQTENTGACTLRYFANGAPAPFVQRFSENSRGIDMEISIEAQKDTLTIGSLALALPYKSPGGATPTDIFEKGFVKHQFIAGGGSFLYFAKPSGKGPFLLVLPQPGTALEYFDNKTGFAVYVHGALNAASEKTGSWRQPLTMQTVLPGQRYTAGFRFRWAHTWNDMRTLLYEEGLFDIRVAPGMTLPQNLPARFSLHTKNQVDSITAEFPDATILRQLPSTLNGHTFYEVAFRRPGENKLTIHHGGQKTYLEFFCTQPLDTLFQKRSRFLVNRQQHRDSSKWYNGLFSIYDMKNSVLRGPDNTDGFDGWWGYMLSGDDAALSKAPYLAAKNVFYPKQEEIDALEYYIEHFVWGRLQRTDAENPFPYGIYGSPNWKENRDTSRAYRYAWSADNQSVEVPGRDTMRLWRAYDYPHLVTMYFHCYELARYYPEKMHYLDAAGYLERAWRTAKAYFEYPYRIRPTEYRIYEMACYNELVLEPLMEALEKEGRPTEARWLRNEYEKKVKYFIYDNPYPWGSEYAFDRTAFESSYAFAKYALTHPLQPDSALWFDRVKKKWYSHPVIQKEDAWQFLERQHYAGLAVRGWLETSYYHLGADDRMSYMAKMGGRSVLDYGLHFADNPGDWLQLGYASYLSSWALVNAGPPESGYGYWFPGAENDGAMGGEFIEYKRGKTWYGRPLDRGPWVYDGEGDLGMIAAVDMARSVLALDPIFGWTAYGARLRETSKQWQLDPQDGIRAKFSFVQKKDRLHFELNRDGWVSAPDGITVQKDARRFRFRLENRSGNHHSTVLTVYSLSQPLRKPTVTMDGKKLETVQKGSGVYKIILPVSRPEHVITVVR